MKILHTSDWHLGQSFYDWDRSAEHQAFLDWLVEVLVTQQVDVLLVSGDIYDNSNPPTSSQRMLSRFIAQAKLRCPHLQMILTGGNHDSGARLESPRDLAQAFDTYLMGNMPRRVQDDEIIVNWDELILPLRDRDGTIRAWCGAVPFVRPEEWSLFRESAQAQYGDQSYQSCLKSLYGELAVQMSARRQGDQKLIAMGHLHLSAGTISGDSERPLHVGGEEAVDHLLFGSEFDYVALGHLHKEQFVAAAHIRYSGSPLPMNFAELNYKHQVYVLHLDQEIRIENFPIPRLIPLLQIPTQGHGTKAEVLQELTQWPASDPTVPKSQWPYVQIRVQLDHADPDLGTDIQNAAQNLPLRICRIEGKVADGTNESSLTPIMASAGLQNLHPSQLFMDLYRQKQNQAPRPELLEAFAQLLQSAQQSLEAQP